MQTTTEQRQQLIAAMQQDPEAKTLLDNYDAYTVQQWLNAPAAPEVLAWRANVPADAVEASPDYTLYDNLTAGSRSSWDRFVTRNRDFTQESVRKWVVDIWRSKGDENLANILRVGTEPATRAQAILSRDSQVSAGTLTALVRSFVAQVDEDDANRIVNGT